MVLGRVSVKPFRTVIIQAEQNPGLGHMDITIITLNMLSSYFLRKPRVNY
jgi:hypothetical protein